MPHATPTLMAWLIEQLARGCSPGSLMQAMLDSGWDLTDASEALLKAATPGAAAPVPVPAFNALRRDKALLPTVEAWGCQAGTLALPDLARPGAHRVRAADRDVRILMDLAHPRLVVVADLLSTDECDALIEAAKGRLQRSQTVSAQHAHTAEVNAARTSEGMFFYPGELDVVTLLEQRIAALFQWPMAQAEGLQVLRYQPGAQYRPHFDHFDAHSPGGQVALARGGQRVGTVVVYLATPEQGGATVFPDLGLQIHAHAGHAVFFSYDVSQGGHGVLHGGAEVQAGEKWVATRWLREKNLHECHPACQPAKSPLR
jgi:prolyl 4-hydroxylase